MFKWLKRMGPAAGGLEDINARFGQMLEDGRHAFDAAANGLLGGTDPGVIRQDLFSTDARINSTEQRIRRQLVIHGSVHGATHFPELLVMMSLVKDAERIGDYAKNLFDLCGHPSQLVDEQEHNKLVVLKDRISTLLVRARNLHFDQNEGSALEFLKEADEVEDQCDEAVHRLMSIEGHNAATAVLTYRYFKRVASHASNIVTSLVMPVDKLDFFDEPKV